MNIDNTNYASIVIGLVIGLVFVSAICTLASIGFSHKRVRQMMTQFCCMISIQFLLVGFTLYFSWKNYNSMGSRLDCLKTVSVVNDCGDLYSGVQYSKEGLEWDFMQAKTD